jgi:argininosuccinate lyase
LTYNKDMQEDKEHLFDTADTLELTLAAARGMLGPSASTASGWPRRPPMS